MIHHGRCRVVHDAAQLLDRFYVACELVRAAAHSAPCTLSLVDLLLFDEGSSGLGAGEGFFACVDALIGHRGLTSSFGTALRYLLVSQADLLWADGRVAGEARVAARRRPPIRSHRDVPLLDTTRCIVGGHVCNLARATDRLYALLVG